MWTIPELKQRGWSGMKKNYWLTVLVALIGAVVCGGKELIQFESSGTSGFHAGVSGSGAALPQYWTEGLQEMPYFWNNIVQMMHIFGAIIAVAAAVAGILVLVFRIFVANPLEIGVKQYMLRHTNGYASLDALLHGFRNFYLDNVKTMFLRKLYIFLWSLLLVIPGIVKRYSYRLVPYILAEHPEMDAKEVLETSRRLMDGHKWHTFLLDLSFIGWGILSAVTFGICGLLIQNPYCAMTEAYLFLAIAHPEAEQPFCDPVYHN